MYEEIGDAAMGTPTTAQEEDAPPRVPATAAVPLYEDVMMPAKSSDSYNITICEAYGTSLGN